MSKIAEAAKRNVAELAEDYEFILSQNEEYEGNIARLEDQLAEKDRDIELIKEELNAANEKIAMLMNQLRIERASFEATSS